MLGGIVLALSSNDVSAQTVSVKRTNNLQSVKLSKGTSFSKPPLAPTQNVNAMQKVNLNVPNAVNSNQKRNKLNK